MILAIDCGNTHITLGCVDACNTASHVFRLPTDARETDYGYAAKIRQILDMQEVDIAALEGVAISCVVPQIAKTLIRAAKLLVGRDPLVIGAGVKTGLHIAINDPGTVASDLVVGAVAAKTLYPLPCLVVDMGTATTVSAVDAKGRFIGCAIAPGAILSSEALSQKTALLPHIEITPPRSPIGACTVDAMRSGILYGTAGLVDALVERFEEVLGEPAASRVATGGVSALIAPHCKSAPMQDEHLLLKGLRIIWDKNQAKM